MIRSVFVSEYLCGGAWPAEALPESLAAEGRAMVEALVEDFAALPDVRVLTTWDQRLAPPAFLSNSHVQTRWIQNPAQEKESFDQLAAEADATLVIAPEFDSILEQRCLQVFQCHEENLLDQENLIPASKSAPSFASDSKCERRRLNSTPAAIHLCADKLAVFELCERLGIPTIPTRRLETCSLSQLNFRVEKCAASDNGAESRETDPNPKLRGSTNPQCLPCVVKRRDGAGSLGMQLISTQHELQQWRMSVSPEQSPEKYIEQPWYAGTPCSMAALVQAGRVCALFPVALQHLSTEGKFRYLGGTIPAPGIEPDWLKPTVLRLVEAIPGLSGYIGFDFLIGSQSEEPVLVEINPRLCTSYVGYRKLCAHRLTDWLLNPQADSAPKFTGSVTFDAAGNLPSTGWRWDGHPGRELNDSSFR